MAFNWVVFNQSWSVWKAAGFGWAVLHGALWKKSGLHIQLLGSGQAWLEENGRPSEDPEAVWGGTRHNTEDNGAGDEDLKILDSLLDIHWMILVFINYIF